MTLAGIALGMIDRPAQAMQAAAQRPRSWWVPALLIVLSMAAAAWIQAPLQIEQQDQRAEQMIKLMSGSLPPEQVALIEESTTGMTLSTFMLSAVGVGALLAAAGWLFRSVAAHFSSMALGGKSVFGSSFAVAVWSMLPFVLRDALQTIYVLVNGRLIEYQGLSSLVASGDWLQDSRSIPFALLASIDPFVVWSIILFSIGISVSTQVRRGTAVVVACLIWGAVLALKLVSVAIGAAATGNLMG
ncbi:MAG: YIP1 family protein [Anaerolineae bacterium]